MGSPPSARRLSGVNARRTSLLQVVQKESSLLSLAPNDEGTAIICDTPSDMGEEEEEEEEEPQEVLEKKRPRGGQVGKLRRKGEKRTCLTINEHVQVIEYFNSFPIPERPTLARLAEWAQNKFALSFAPSIGSLSKLLKRQERILSACLLLHVFCFIVVMLHIHRALQIIGSNSEGSMTRKVICMF